MQNLNPTQSDKNMVTNNQHKDQGTGHNKGALSSFFL